MCILSPAFVSPWQRSKMTIRTLDTKDFPSRTLQPRKRAERTLSTIVEVDESCVEIFRRIKVWMDSNPNELSRYHTFWPCSVCHFYLFLFLFCSQTVVLRPLGFLSVTILIRSLCFSFNLVPTRVTFRLSSLCVLCICCWSVTMKLNIAIGLIKVKTKCWEYLRVIWRTLIFDAAVAIDQCFPKNFLITIQICLLDHRCERRYLRVAKIKTNICESTIFQSETRLLCLYEYRPAFNQNTSVRWELY